MPNIDFGNTIPSFQEYKNKLGYGNASGSIEDNLGQQYNKIFGKEEYNGSNPNWYQQLFQTGSDIQNQTTGNYKGPEYDFLTNQLKDILSGGLPNRAQLEQQGKTAIGQSTNQAVQRTKENLAGSGLYRSGVGQSAISGIYGNEANAVGALESNLNQAEVDRKNQAINQLLGLSEFAGSSGLQERGQNLNYAQFLQGLSEGGRQQDLAYSNQSSPFTQLLGSLIGGAAQAGTSALLASDKKLKENIKEEGETESGLPIVSFNYKDDPNKTRIKGHLAQSIEKIIPNAVFKVIDYSKLPEDAKFEVVNA